MISSFEVVEQSADTCGREAVQFLLEPIQDEPGRIVVVLAGYPQPMERLVKQKDANFGNGWTAYNLFAKAIPRHALRIVEITPVSRELLSTLQPEDIELE